MKRLLLSLVLLAVLAVPSFVPTVLADEPVALPSSIGIAQIVDNNIAVTYTGKNFVNAKGVTQYEYKAVISQAPIYNDDGSKVDCSWHGTKEGTYSIVDNVFTATVTGSEISTTYQGETMSWNPVVWIDSQEYVSKDSPKVLAVDPINSNYKNNVLEWDYGVCVRRVRVIEGTIQETWIFSENPRGTVWIKDNSEKSHGFTWAVAPYAYDANDNPIEINEYKQVMASEFDRVEKEGGYPVTIDPTEVFVTDIKDGQISGAWASATGSQSDNNHYIEIGYQSDFYRGFVFFNTSSLAGVTIVSANLSLYGSYDSSATDFNVSIQSGQPTYPHLPLVTGDFNKSFYGAIVGGSINTSAGWSTSGYNNISLNTTGLTWINKSGTTKLCLRSSIDISTGTTTTTWVKAYSYDEGAGRRPYLEVTYTTSAVPTVVTYSPASSVTGTSAVCNGSVTDNGSNVITEYGICYGLFANPDTSGTHNSTAADKLGNFSFILTPLTAGQTYHYRAFATNVVGTSYGAEYTFLTSPNASIVTTNPATAITPSQARLNGYLNSDGGETCQVRFQYASWNGTAWVGNTSSVNQSKTAGESFVEDLVGLSINTQYAFRAESFNSYGQSNGSWLFFNTTVSTAYIGGPTAICYSSSESIELSWIKGKNSSSTYIRWKIGSYPTGIYDGTLIPLQLGSGYTHTGLTPGTSYFYKLWGYDSGNTSTTNTTTMCTTTAGGGSTATPIAPAMPDTWFSGTNTSKLQGLPFYQIVTDMGDAGQIPATTWWFMILLGGVMTGGLLIYSRSKNLFIACILIMVLLTVLSIMVLMPMWIVYAFAIASMGLSWKDLR